MMLLDGQPVNAAPTSRSRPRAARSRPSRASRTATQLSPLQAAFLEHGGVQCGFCTPGMLISATALLGGEPARRPRTRCGSRSRATSAAAPATTASSRPCSPSPAAQPTRTTSPGRRRRSVPPDRRRPCPRGRGAQPSSAGGARPRRVVAHSSVDGEGAPVPRCPARPGGDARGARVARGRRDDLGGAAAVEVAQVRRDLRVEADRERRRAAVRAREAARAPVEAAEPESGRDALERVEGDPPVRRQLAAGDREHAARADENTRLAARIDGRAVAAREHAKTGVRRAARGRARARRSQRDRRPRRAPASMSSSVAATSAGSPS